MCIDGYFLNFSLKERTKRSRVLACNLHYGHRQKHNVALLDKSIKCWQTINQVASTRIVQTCFILCRQSIKTGTCLNDNSVEQSIKTTLSALNPQETRTNYSCAISPGWKCNIWPFKLRVDVNSFRHTEQYCLTPVWAARWS